MFYLFKRLIHHDTNESYGTASIWIAILLRTLTTFKIVYFFGPLIFITDRLEGCDTTTHEARLELNFHFSYCATFYPVLLFYWSAESRIMNATSTKSTTRQRARSSWSLSMKVMEDVETCFTLNPLFIPKAVEGHHKEIVLKLPRCH
jgi:hypothetical protein